MYFALAGMYLEVYKRLGTGLLEVGDVESWVRARLGSRRGPGEIEVPVDLLRSTCFM